ncbi:nucleoside-diphosphate kinase [Fodinicola acaciae]|uniref:nucleoside-diphosphate kinase n=1 Tax=Fodinicola acaciae TaxID=2681555 RepID=UPI0013D89F53|nr:nucleoside-diphosphate kinase [Fodinicola acaciae]
MRVPDWCSDSPEKRVVFGSDPYVVETWRELPAGWLPATTFLLLRPEAIVARVGCTVLGRARSAGFTPLTAVPIRFDRRMVREIWRHDLNGTPPSRLRLLDFLLTAGDCLLVVVRHPDDAARRLRALKGPSQPRDRRPHHLRSLPGVSQVGPLTYVHTPDEPIDVVRELGIFLDTEQRRRVFAATSDDVVRTLTQLENAVEYRDFSLEPALDRIRPYAPSDLIGEDAAWLRVQDNPRISRWDAVAVAAHSCAERNSVPPTYVCLRDEFAKLAGART